TTEPPQAESVSLDSDSVGVEESSETPRGGGTKVVITLVVLAILVLFMVIGVVVGVRCLDDRTTDSDRTPTRTKGHTQMTSKSSALAAAEAAARKLADAAGRIAEDVAGRNVFPGAPASAAPSVEEPTQPADPLSPKPDQKGATPYGPTGRPSADDEEAARQQ